MFLFTGLVDDEEGYMRFVSTRLVGRRAGYALLLVVAMLLWSSATALAAPPPNDTRTSAQQLKLGDRVNGTTVDATADEDDRFGCGPSDQPSVWYRIDANTNGRAIADLQAHGDLDVTLDVYVRQRSQFSSLACDNSDRRGRATTDWRFRKGQSYLIRVVERQQSVSGTFTLTVDLGTPPAEPPGRALPRSGGTGTVQRVFEPSNAWSTSLREGTTYRVNLSPESCTRLSIYGPNPDSFDGRPRRVLGCGGYTQFTPGPHGSGRYSFLVEPASSRRTPQSYRLTVARAGIDDTVPGRFVRNHTAMRGHLNASRVDVLDLYRFDVTQNSITDLVLRGSGRGDFDVRLLSAGGKRIACGCSGGLDQNIHVRTHPGRYFVAVKAHRHAAGRYRLSRASKTITHSGLTITPVTAPPGSSVNLRVSVSPGGTGPVTILIQRFDPTSGWVFIKRYELRAVNGSTSVTYRPPSVGRYRARAIFPSTSRFAGSKTGYRNFRVQGPLEEYGGAGSRSRRSRARPPLPAVISHRRGRHRFRCGVHPARRRRRPISKRCARRARRPSKAARVRTARLSRCAQLDRARPLRPPPCVLSPTSRPQWPPASGRARAACLTDTPRGRRAGSGRTQTPPPSRSSKSSSMPTPCSDS